MALVLSLVVLPIALYAYKMVTSSVRFSVADRRQKVASGYANAAIEDYFRQFSQNNYSGHYDADSLNRPEALYSAGYSTVTYIADAQRHTLYIKARGGYGSSGSPKTVRVLEAVVQFFSDLVRFGTMVNGPFTVSASNVRYDGGFYVNGNLTITGANVTYNGGPVIVNGSVTGPASVTIDGDLYYSGASAGAVTVTGTRYNYVPTVTWPTLDFNYYAANYTYMTTVDQAIVFNSTGTFTVVGGATYAIPPSGALIYAQNANLTVRGIVSGPITVVAGSNVNGNCSSATGKITVNDNLYYVGASSVAAAATAAFAGLATNCVTFSKAGADLLAVGVYFVQNGTVNMQATGSAGRRFLLYGVRTQGISVTNFSLSLNYDANLRSFQPPGLPEKALLVSWDPH